MDTVIKRLELLAIARAEEAATKGGSMSPEGMRLAREAATYRNAAQIVRDNLTVAIDNELLNVFADAWHRARQDGTPGTRRRAGLAAVFERLGIPFEVTE